MDDPERHALGSLLARLDERMTRHEDAANEWREAVRQDIHGILKSLNGDNGQASGIVVRLALLEAAEKRRDRWFWIFAGATATAVVTAVSSGVYAMVKFSGH